ncbi:MAG: FAD-dependent thymidylate synthase [Thermodesulfobacteriota bacterium]
MAKRKDTGKKDDIGKYISSPRGDIYTVSGLPEEVVAVIFAYVSRSPASFKKNIAKVLEEEGHGRERAEKFHEKWVLNYGHASVAEHATVHIGIERVSRLFSAILETGAEHLSFTEYSQRYQRPRREDFVIPPELEKKAALKKRFLSVCGKQYDIYEKLNEKLFEYLKGHNREGLSEGALEKIAFEDARYALNLSSMTNLGLTANARAVEESLMKLLSSPYGEARRRAEEIKKEVRFSVPTLVKYATENDYIKSLEGRSLPVSVKVIPTRNAPHVKLLDWTGKGAKNSETVALHKTVSALLYKNSRGISSALKLPRKTLEKEFARAVKNLGKHDNPHPALRQVSYTAEFTISEACWHQLLRHRKADWFAKEPDVCYGITVPPNVKKAGMEDVLMESVKLSEKLFRDLARENRQAARYAVTNAHNRKVVGSFTLWELYHLINLRMSEGAQWDIREMTEKLANLVKDKHPVLVEPALKRVGA